MASNQNKGSNQNKSRIGINAAFLGSVFLGLCVIFSGIFVGTSMRKLSKTVEEKSFSNINNVTSPEIFSLSEKKYLTEAQAADYLNLSTQEVVNLITSGEISEYVKTDEGYSIAVKVLDEWFDNEAYQNKLSSGTSPDETAN